MTTIIDTSIIVALLNRRDTYHHWCKTEAADLPYPFFTCEAVLSESFFLLKKTVGGSDALTRLIEKQLLQVPFHYDKHSKDIHNILRTYSDLPLSFADACLIQMAETTKGSRIFTLDNDFTVYRTSEDEVLPLISPY